MWVKIDLTEDTYLEHHQIKGAKHGLRRFQDFNGKLTWAGRERYGVGPPRMASKSSSELEKSYKKAVDQNNSSAERVKVRRSSEKGMVAKSKNESEKAFDESLEKSNSPLMSYNDRAKAKKQQEEKEAAAAEKAKAKAEAAAEKAQKREEDRQAKEAAKERVELAKKGIEEGRERAQEEAAKKKAETKGNLEEEKSEQNSDDKNQNESAKKKKVPFSSGDYASAERAFGKGSEQFNRNANLVEMVSTQRRSNAVRKAIGKRELSKPISEMSDKEINDTINRWASEERLAQMSVGQKSQAAENISTALKVMGNVTATVGGVFGIASEIRKITERR